MSTSADEYFDEFLLPKLKDLFKKKPDDIYLDDFLNIFHYAIGSNNFEKFANKLLQSMTDEVDLEKQIHDLFNILVLYDDKVLTTLSYSSGPSAINIDYTGAIDE